MPSTIILKQYESVILEAIVKTIDNKILTEQDAIFEWTNVVPKVACLGYITSAYGSFGTIQAMKARLTGNLPGTTNIILECYQLDPTIPGKQNKVSEQLTVTVTPRSLQNPTINVIND